jgi:hypothetical protein
METNEVQQQFFNYLRQSMPAHLSLVDELMDLLDISADSVYRRLRGEKPITLSELKLICEKYHISLDHVLQLQQDAVVFSAPDISRSYEDFNAYLNGYLVQLRYFNSFAEKQLLYLCKDVPVWHFFSYPEVAAFKTFVWLKTILNIPDYANKRFSLAEFPFEDCYRLGQEMISLYNQIPSVELWNFESINSTVRQLEYYRDAGIFSQPSDIAVIAESFERSIDHIQLQAEKGVKFLPGSTDVTHRAPLKFYINEVILGNNSILAELNGNKVSFVNYNVINYLFTKDQRFSEILFSNFYTLMSRSTLISGTGEKERNRFFSALKERIRKIS